jgi:hypothetical protein
MNRELGAFLQARRSEVTPEDVGLARGPRRRVRGLRREEVAELLDRMADVPALVADHRLDVLAWNRLGTAIFPGLCRRGGNLARYNLLEPGGRELYAEREEILRATVGQLRLEVLTE